MSVNRPFPIKKWAKTSQNDVYLSQFISVKFWWKFHENPNKIAKLQLHENLHKNVNENMFSFTSFLQIFMSFLEGNLSNKYFTALYYSFQFILNGCIKFSLFWWLRWCFSPNLTGPWSWLQKSRKIPGTLHECSFFIKFIKQVGEKMKCDWDLPSI